MASKCLYYLEKARCSGYGPARRGRRGLPRRPSDAEALAAAAFALGFGILELEGLVEPLFDEIDHGAVDQRQARRIDHDFDAARLENRIAGTDLIRIIDHIRETRTAGLLDADTQADAGAALCQM